jgi:PIN domain nuclease of toxin-antitoxin system
LSGTARGALVGPANAGWLSPIFLVEIAVKVRLGRLPLPNPYETLFPAELLANDIHLLLLENQQEQVLGFECPSF